MPKAQPATIEIDERAAFNAWNNEDNLPIAGVGAKNAAWLAWQARAKLAGNSPVIPEGWQVEAEKLAEMHGMSFVLFRHGEAPQCADPTKVVISFTDKGLGHDTEPQNAQQNIPEIIPGWIPVSERLPDKNQSVLISVNFDSSLVDPLICTARYTGSTFRRGEATVKPGSGIEEVTHWMSLPAGPREEK
ncbi:TPA: DUF551 domain-containing protein [Klebsiella oxytoca]|nr:DUF551 domain-containing protein [Klebsiella oxytoca]HEP0773144.1 DUF551 domain-containing protein [Klebsiella oxytoca]